MARMPHVAGVEHRHVQAGDLSVHVAEAGTGDPVLLLHGWPQHWYMWRALMPALAGDYRVIAPDLRGHGWTDAPGHGYEKEQMASDVLRLMDALELDRVRLVGHDWGGWIGWLLCMREPDRFERYLALNIALPWPTVDLRGLGDLWRVWYQLVIAAPVLGEWLLRNKPGFVTTLIKANASERDVWTASELRSFLAPLEEPERARASSLLYRTFLLRELGPVTAGRYRSSRLSTPTLLLFGTGDKAISRRMVTGHEPYADDLRVELVETSGHWIAEEQPDLVADRALEFFAAAANGPTAPNGSATPAADRS